MSSAQNSKFKTMHMSPMRDFDEFRDAISAYRLPRILLTALDLDLFTVMGARSWTVPVLAKRLRVSTRGLNILCRNLASAGVLKKNGAQYRNGSLALTVLNAKSQQYRGAYLELLRGHWEDWSQLTKSVRTGRPVEHEDPDDPDYRRQFTWAMHHRSSHVAPHVAAQINLKGVETLLDLGGGPGTFALAFLARHPTLRATVCDRPSALEVAKEIAIWLSNVLHIYSPSENQRLFRRLVKALTPRGRLLIQDAFCHDRNGLSPQETNLFAVTMLLFTETGNTYGARETAEWLREAGFGMVRRIRLRKGTEDWEGGLLEASRPNRHEETRLRRQG